LLLNHKIFAMFKVNQYFDGKVVSLSHESGEGTATVGVMAAGEYLFGTSSIEIMTVISGQMQVKLPGSTSWKTYKKSESFKVEKGISFGVKVEEDTPYHCLYK
jgi:purine/pyrimidine-nucleoside phosphorylase